MAQPETTCPQPFALAARSTTDSVSESPVIIRLWGRSGALSTTSRPALDGGGKAKSQARGRGSVRVSASSTAQIADEQSYDGHQVDLPDNGFDDREHLAEICRG